VTELLLKSARWRVETMSEKAEKKAPARKKSAKKAAPKKSARHEKVAATPAPAEKKETREPAPWPMVHSRHGLELHERRARGYSMGELASAGITYLAASRATLPLDIRRRSVLGDNVSKLKGWYQPEPKRQHAEAAEEPEAVKKTASKPRKSAKSKKS